MYDASPPRQDRTPAEDAQVTDDRDVVGAPADAETAAREADLRWMNDLRPGIRRRRAGKGFSYRSPAGDPITDPERLAWIRSLAVPPAWNDVWICPVRNGHILATGRDARGRKQYRYHPRWRAARDATKYTRLIDFGEGLPRIRRCVERDLALPGLPRDRVVAAVVRLLDRTFIRVGNEEYARLNDSFGLTTLRNRHVRVEGTHLRFRFRGKSGREHDVGLRDRPLAGVIRRIQELPGQELFEYLDDAGQVQSVASDDVNRYLRDAAGADITAKEFRTWAGSVLAFRALSQMDVPTSEADGRRRVAAAIREVADHLRNTPAVCRASYVHPAVLDAYLEGSLAEERAGAARSDATVDSREPNRREELAVLRVLRARRAAIARAAARTSAKRRRASSSTGRASAPAA